MKKYIYVLILFVLIISCKAEKEKNKKQEVTVYTHRHYKSDQDLFAKFEKETGIKVNVVNAKADELIQKMSLEGSKSPADVLITVDAGRLVRATDRGLLQPITSEVLNKTIPLHLKDTDNNWFGLTKRARVIVYNPEKVKAEDLSNYEDLANKKWKNKLLIRSSENIYNQSLLASIIANLGEEKATEWAKMIVKNMARSPKGNDRDQVKAIMAGEADIAIVNSYYIGKMISSKNKEEAKAGNGIKIFFPNQEDRGTHINVSGAGVAKHAPNKENAIKFIEFLAGIKAQKIFAESNYEYPVSAEVEMSDLLKSWGIFKEDALSLTELGKNNKKAVMIFDKVGWK